MFYRNLLCLLSLLVVANLSFGQVQVSPDSPDFVFVGSAQTPGTDLATLLLDPNVVKDLDILPYQEKSVRKLIEDIGRENFQAAQPLMAGEVSNEKYGETIEQNEVAFEGVLTMTLLPHQMKLLKQIRFAKLTQGVDIARSFSAKSPISKLLGLTEDERQNLAAKSKEVNSKFKEEVEKLRRKSIEEILNVLPPEKQRDFEAMFGMDVKSPAFETTEKAKKGTPFQLFKK